MKALVKRLMPNAAKWLQSRRGVWRDYWSTGEYELRELPRYVDRSRSSLDVGGNTGVYTYHLSRLSKSVITFEPNPQYVSRIQALGLSNVRIEQAALSDHAGQAQLRIPAVAGREDGGMASLSALAVSDEAMARVIDVPLKRLDDYQLSDIGFIKIDVEGHEEDVLQGALDTIRRCRPNLLIEVEERHNPGGLERITALLGANGYSGYFFLEGQRRPIGEFSAPVHQLVSPELERAGHNRRSLRYVNNFLFVV